MGTKTSVYLSDDLAARWRGSQLSLGELIRRGLDTAGIEDIVRRVIREELTGVTVPATDSSEEQARTMQAPPPIVAAIGTEPEQTDTATRGCKHSAMRVRKGVCPTCKEWVSPNS